MGVGMGMSGTRSNGSGAGGGTALETAGFRTVGEVWLKPGTAVSATPAQNRNGTRARYL